MTDEKLSTIQRCLPLLILELPKAVYDGIVPHTNEALAEYQWLRRQLTDLERTINDTRSEAWVKEQLLQLIEQIRS